MFSALAAFMLAITLGQPPADRVAEIRVQGNYRTPEAEVLQIAGVHVGDPLTADTVRVITDRLRKSGRFDTVDVRQRWRTLDASGDATIVILLREQAGGSGIGGRAVYAATHLMALPVLSYTDGYGLTYGGQVSPPNLLGKSTHVSIPLTWGGTKQAAIDVNRPLSSGPLTRLAVNAGIRERENPFYELDDNRIGGSIRIERRFERPLRVGFNGSIHEVRFGDVEDVIADPRVVPGDRQTLGVWGADLTLDTRRSPDTARNDVFVEAAWDELERDSGSVGRYRVDARGYVGLPYAGLLMLRAYRGDATSPLPAYERFLFGGAESVRGFRPGFLTGDSVVTGTAEFQQPFTSPLSFGRMGARAFIDYGTVYETGERLEDAKFYTGVGGGLFLNAAFFNLSADVARGLDHGWHVHVMGGLQF
jgi:outer membrane protein assembly factor BamA